MAWLLFLKQELQTVILNGFTSAVRTLTVIPVPGYEINKRYHSLPWFIVTGFGIGLLQYYLGGVLFNWESRLLYLSAFLMVALNYLLTGGLHLDGLADVADAFGNNHNREKTLTILKDSHIGVFGTGAVVSGIICRIMAYSYLLNLNKAIWIVYGISISRLVQALILLHVPYVRGSEGKAFGYKGSPYISIILLLELTVFSMYVVLNHDLIPILFSFSIAVFVVVPLLLLIVKRLGGITGDCIGAITEIFEYSFFTGVILISV